MPDMSGVEVLRAAKQIDQDILGIMITAFASTETAVEAMRLGACDYLSKPFDVDLLKMKVREKIENRQLRQENVLLKRTLGLSHQFSNIIGRSEAMLDVFKMIETVARTNSTILLTGESGTGKGLVAQAIHFHSLRRDKPMVAAQLRRAAGDAARVGAVRPHARGVHRRRHQQEGAARGRREGHRLPRRDRRDERRDAGEAAARAAGAAVPPRRRPRGAAGRHPRHRRDQPGPDEGASPTGRFREDLFYRINVIPIALPPLRERREDIPLLAEHFLAKYAEQMGKPITGISHEAMELLHAATTGPATSASSRTSSSAPWRSRATPTILPDSLPPSVRGEPSQTRARRRPTRCPTAGFDLEAHVKEIERGYIAAGARAGRRRAGEGRRAARHELPVVPLLREEIQPSM